MPDYIAAAHRCESLVAAYHSAANDLEQVIAAIRWLNTATVVDPVDPDARIRPAVITGLARTELEVQADALAAVEIQLHGRAVVWANLAANLAAEAAAALEDQ